MHEIVVYSRHGCHLCEVMLEQVESLCRGRALVIVRDVDTNPDWENLYGLEVPVLILDGKEVCRYQFDEAVFVAAMNKTVSNTGEGV